MNTMIKMMLSVILLPAVLATPPTDHDCGMPAIAPNMNKIVGGTDAIPYSWPWQAQIRFYSVYWCGGALISPGMYFAGHV
jgi:hypothetical protein